MFLISIEGIQFYPFNLHLNFFLTAEAATSSVKLNFNKLINLIILTNKIALKTLVLIFLLHLICQNCVQLFENANLKKKKSRRYELLFNSAIFQSLPTTIYKASGFLNMIPPGCFYVFDV